MNLPIAERELRLASRMPRTYWGRLKGAMIFGVLSAWFFWIVSKAGVSTMAAAETYKVISYAALAMCLFSVHTTVDVLSSEKRNGTLGLLFLTDLKSVDIIAGKLAAAGLMGFYTLVAILPIMSIPVLMGGITGQNVFRTSVTLLNTLFLSLSFGLWVSARSWDAKRAKNAGAATALLFLWGIPGLAVLTHLKFKAMTLAENIMLISPAYQLSFSHPFSVGLFHDKYWISVAITHAFAWFALWRACRVLPDQWQDKPAMGVRHRFTNFLHDLKFGAPEARAALRRRLLNSNAIYWLSSREKLAPFWTWFFIAVIMIGWVGFWAFMNFIVEESTPFWSVGIGAVMMMHLGLRMRTCTVAADVITRDRFSGALELLLSTRLSEKDVVRGHWLSIGRTVLIPAIFSVVIATCLFAAGMAASHNVEDRFYGWMIFLAMMTLFALDMVASFWTSLWMACTTKTTNGAPGAALFRLLLMPWMIFAALMTLIGIFEVQIVREFIQVFAFWFGIGVVNNFVWIRRSRSKFYGRLRLVAAERYQPKPPRAAWWRLQKTQVAEQNPLV